MNKRDDKLFDILGKARDALVRSVIRISKGAPLEIIDDVVISVQSAFDKWSRLRITENYLIGVDRVTPIDLIDYEKFETITQATLVVNQEVALLGPRHVAANQAIINDINARNAAAAESMVDKIKLIQPGETLDGISEILKTNQQSFKKKKSLISFFRENGISYLTDRSGRKRTIERYAEMLTRTSIGIAQNQGTVNRARETGTNLLIREERVDACPICQPHRGEIRNLEKQGTPPLLYHPNCRGIWIGYFG